MARYVALLEYKYKFIPYDRSDGMYNNVNYAQLRQHMVQCVYLVFYHSTTGLLPTSLGYCL